MPNTPKPRTRFVDLYRARGYTQETLAAATGVSQSAVSRYGSGRTILAEHVAALAIALDTSPAYLDGATDDPAPAPASDAAEHTLESAILRALDKARHTLADARAVEDVLRGTIGLVKAEHLDAAAREKVPTGIAWSTALRIRWTIAGKSRSATPLSSSAAPTSISSRTCLPKPEIGPDRSGQQRQHVGGHPPEPLRALARHRRGQHQTLLRPRLERRGPRGASASRSSRHAHAASCHRQLSRRKTNRGSTTPSGGPARGLFRVDGS